MTALEPPVLSDADLGRLCHAYRLGTVHAVAYLPQGLMNRNWQIVTETGRYAVKQLLDVSLLAAQRNLGILAALHDKGIPVCRPMSTRDAELVVQIDNRGFCVLPWMDGGHPTGPELTHPQVRHLGVVVGSIHRELNGPGLASALPAVGSAPASPVTPPEEAIAEAERFQTAASRSSDPFDTAVVDLLDERIALIHQHAARRPTGDHPRGPYGWTHGDLQYRNIIWVDGVIGAVIDWDRIRVRPFAEEIVRTATIQFATPLGLDLDRISTFVAGYRSIIPIDGSALADGVHRHWWKRLSDFWHLVFHYDRDNYGCDDLFISGESLLHWWTQHSTEVHDAFTDPT